VRFLFFLYLDLLVPELKPHTSLLPMEFFQFMQRLQKEIFNSNRLSESFQCVTGWYYDKPERPRFNPGCCKPSVRPLQPKEICGTEHSAASRPAVKI